MQSGNLPGFRVLGFQVQVLRPHSLTYLWPPAMTLLAALSLSSAGWSHTFLSTVMAASGEAFSLSTALTPSEFRKAL